MCGGIPKTFFTRKWTLGLCGCLAERLRLPRARVFPLWDGDYCAFAAFALFDIFVFSIVFYGIWNCRYVFGESSLEICGFWRMRIQYSGIRNFRDTFDIMSAPACSLDRIEIGYDGKSGKRLRVCVSARATNGVSPKCLRRECAASRAGLSSRFQVKAAIIVLISPCVFRRIFRI